MLVTNNRQSMPIHLRDHLADGRHVPGILTVRQPRTDWGTVVDHLVLIWHAVRPDFRDRIDYLPLR